MILPADVQNGTDGAVMKANPPRGEFSVENRDPRPTPRSISDPYLNEYAMGTSRQALSASPGNSQLFFDPFGGLGYGNDANPKPPLNGGLFERRSG